MKLSAKQLPSGKWGIYNGANLLATVDCQSTCKTIMANYTSGRRDAPTQDTHELYQVPQLRKYAATETTLSAGQPDESRPNPAQINKKQVNRLSAATVKSTKAEQLITKPATIKQATAKQKVAEQKVAEQKTSKRSSKASKLRSPEEQSKAMSA